MAENPITAALGSMFGAVRGMVTKATAPERAEPGPGDVGPSTDTKKGELVSLQMPPDEVGQWWKRIEKARARVRNQEKEWEILLKEYLPIVSASGEPETVKVQEHFRNVHSKIGMLFYRSPDLVMTPKDPSPAQNQLPNPMGGPPLTMEDIIAVKQAVLTEKLGRDGIKANRLMDELLFDNLAWAGIGCSKLGYRCVFKSLPKMGPDPNWAPPMGMDPMGPPDPTAVAPQVPQIGLDGQPVMEDLPIFEEWYWRRFSPKKLLFNDDLRSSRYDEDATWMGMEFYLSPKQAMARFKLTEEEVSKATSDDRVYKHEGEEPSPGLVHGVELWVKASCFTDEPHPQAINQLVLIEGINEKPVVWRPSPDQEFDPMTGKLTADSLIGFPIRVLTIRDLADSPFPKSDSAFTNSEIKQLSTWLRQSVQLRDAAIGKYLYDMDAFDKETDIPLMQGADVGVYIGVAGGKLAQGADKVFTTTAQLHQTNDDYRAQETFRQSIRETLGISANAGGTSESTVRTAEEIRTVGNAVAGRSEKEQSRAADFYLDGARMIDQLLMRYADATEYIEITGHEGAQRMQMWNNQMISGRYLYKIAPDSMMRVDTAQDFQAMTQHFNIVAADPLTNRPYFLRRMAQMRGLDPAKAVLPTMPEPKQEFKMGMTFKGEDLANPLVVALLVKMGVITEEEAALNQPVMPPHEGTAAEKAPVISQHTASNSGGTENAPGSSDFRAAQAK